MTYGKQRMCQACTFHALPLSLAAIANISKTTIDPKTSLLFIINSHTSNMRISVSWAYRRLYAVSPLNRIPQCLDEQEEQI
jgi:hypothetical protein